MHRAQDLLARKAGIFQMRQLMSARIGGRFFGQEAAAFGEIVELGARIGMCDRDLDRFAIELFREVDRLLNGLFGLPRQSKNEIAVNGDTKLLAVLDESAR